MNNIIIKRLVIFLLIEITGFYNQTFAAILTGASVYDGVNVNTVYYSDYENTTVSGVSANASWSSSFTNSAGGTATFSGSSTANTSYGGIFKASGDVTLTNYDYQTYINACSSGTAVCSSPAVSATGILGDALQVVKGASTSDISQGYLVITIDVEGNSTYSTTTNISSSSDAAGRFFIYDGPTWASAPVDQFYFTDSQKLTSSPIPIKFGEFKDFNFALDVSASPFDAGRYWSSFDDFLSIDISTLGTYDFSATLNFGNTATITNIQLFADETLQNEITDFQIFSASGIQYPGGTSIVPLPTAFWLFGTGLLGLIGVANKWRSDA